MSVGSQILPRQFVVGRDGYCGSALPGAIAPIVQAGRARKGAPTMVAAFLAELYFLLLATVAHAGQVVHDGTVGPAGALTGPAYVIPDTAGTTRGNNLFHSFSQFDLSEGDSATFTGPANIHNVIARVTGGPSTIDGALNCDIPGANFFFINPFGVIFGEHATVNVSGSFAVTTADYVKLADGGRFDARNPANDVLTAAPVSAFGFLGPTAAPIVIEGLPAEAGDVTMPVFLVDGKSLWVVGGDISLQGTLLGAPAGQIALVSVASAGELGVDVDNPHFQPDTSSFPTLGSVTLSDSGLYLTGVPGGLAIIEADQIRFRNAAILAGNDGDTRGGGVRLIARSEISLDAGSSISALALGDGDGGDVILAAPTIQLRNSSIGTTAVGNGNAGNVLITANDFSILDSAGISAENSGAGAGGNITIQADHVLFRGDPTFGVLGSQAGLTVQTAGGPAGSVHIEATTVELITGGRIVSDSLAGTSPGGAITIKAQTLTLDDHSGNGRTTISSQSIGGGVGGGNIVLDVGTLQVLNGAQITTTSVNAGPAGSINIHATDVTL
ncbi:MAG: filamentous hemagglutinin N-terminal domain-containing protein, partial [Verrucomicrobiota bacterium]